MNKCYVKSLLLTAFVGAGALLPAADIDMQRQHDITLDSYKVDIKQYEDAANEYIARANECFIAGNYKDAAYNYVQARYVLETLKDKSQHFADQLEKVKEQIAKSYYYLAQQMAEEADAAANSNDLKKAIEKCVSALTANT